MLNAVIIQRRGSWWQDGQCGELVARRAVWGAGGKTDSVGSWWQDRQCGELVARQTVWGTGGKTDSVGSWWQDRQCGELVARQAVETEVMGENSVPAPLCQPQSSHALPWDRTVASATGYRQLTRVSRGTACMLHVPLMSSQTKLTYQHLGVSFLDPAVLQMLPRMFLFVRRPGCDHANMATPDRCHYSLLMSGGRSERGK
jgi:hypothetical protein